MDLAGLGESLNPDLFNRKRLMIMTLLYVSGPKVESDLFAALGLSWGDLDSNLRRLKDKGYIDSRKVLRLKGPRTVVFITRKGAAEYRQLVGNLRRVLNLASEDDQKEVKGDDASGGTHRFPSSGDG